MQGYPKGTTSPAAGMPRRIAAPDADLLYWPVVLAPAVADRLLGRLRHEVCWTRHHVRIAGREIACPRLSAWYGDAGAVYAYSGSTHVPAPWIAPVLEAREAVEAAAGTTFNSVLLNLYRDGADSIGWHADDEPELGREPVIASLSLGASRRFVLRHRRRRELAPLAVELAHGSLLLMRGTTQHCWRHALPKTRRPVAARVNLTFRRIVGAGDPGRP